MHLPLILITRSMATFSRGGHTLSVNLSLHQVNRTRLVDSLHPKLDRKPSLILLKGGPSKYRYCSDHEPLFRQESFFHWTFGVQEPDFYGGILYPSGQSVLFSPNLPAEYAVWMGAIATKEQIRSTYDVDQVHYTEDVNNFVADNKVTNVLVLKGINSDSGNESDPFTFTDAPAGVTIDDVTLHPIISELRVFKTDQEIDVLRYINKISSDAHIEVMKSIRSGMFEYQLESIFQKHCYFHGGSRFMSYTCICATGHNGSVLHYGHSGAPNDRQLLQGDMALFDMGGEYYCYASDITCSFPVDGRFTDDQKIVYNAVLNASRAVIVALKPGVSWVDMHMLAEREILTHLKANGILTGDVADMMAVRLGAIFMPHGLGHFMGIDTHDVGGYLDHCPPRSSLPGLKSLRTSRVMQERMCLTIEPGCYFIDHLLNKAIKDETQNKFLVIDQLNRFRGFGGVRIEDDVLITSDGIEMLTQVPRTIEQIEQTMKGTS